MPTINYKPSHSCDFGGFDSKKLDVFCVKLNVALFIRSIEFKLHKVYLRYKPNTDIFKDFITLDETGYIITTPGTGCVAALDAEYYLAAKL